MSDSRRLVIRFQQLAEVPDWVWDRTDLEFLCVSDNRLTGVSTRIANLTNLRTLDIAHNAIESVPDALGALPNLSDYLYLSDNRLTAFPEAVTSLRRFATWGSRTTRSRRCPKASPASPAWSNCGCTTTACPRCRALLGRCHICASSTCPTTV